MFGGDAVPIDITDHFTRTLHLTTMGAFNCKSFFTDANLYFLRGSGTIEAPFHQ